MSIFNKAQPEKTDIETSEKKSGKIKKIVDKRYRNLKAISITSTILFLVIILVFNIVFDKVLGSRLKWDWSTGSQYTIGDVSKEILGSMTKDVKIIGLFDKDADTKYTGIQPMLEEYAKLSSGKITVSYVDPDKDPNIIKTFDPEGVMNPEAETFVVYCPSTGKAKNVAYNQVFDVQYDTSSGYYQSYIAGVTAEQSFSGAIKYVQSETTPVIYFTTGHDELDYETTYKGMIDFMKNNNYEVKSLELFDLEAIPADCATLVIASPQKDLSTAESKLVAEYLKKGGGLMVTTEYNTTSFTELNKLLSDYNIEISNSKIREGNQDYRYQDDPYTIRAIAPVSSLTTKEAVDGFTLMDNVRGINQLKNEKSSVKVEPILTTTEDGIAEEGGDVNKPSAAATQNVGLISENSGWVDGSEVTKSARVMVVGSSSIFSDDMLNISSRLYNGYVFYYGVQWLSNSAADSLYIASKAAVSYAVTKGSSTTNTLTAVCVILLLPGALLLAALFVYRKRKHL